jgi:hypothetical protein
MVLFLVCLSWNVLLRPLVWWHRELFFGWTTVGANVWGYTKMQISSPNTREWNAKAFKSEAQMTQEGTKNLQKTALTSKLMNSFTRALAPPFIGRRRDFYIPKVPSNLWNIPNVNSYMNVFYISYITSLLLVHTSNAGFRGNVFDLASHWFASFLFTQTLTRRNLRI